MGAPDLIDRFFDVADQGDHRIEKARNSYRAEYSHVGVVDESDDAFDDFVAVVAERPVDVPVPVVIVPDTRAALARLADAFYGRPSERVRVIGVTGTKGKTTTTFLVRSIVRAAGRECGLLGTIAYEAFGRSRPSDNTTPDPIEIQAFLASLDRDAAMSWLNPETIVGFDPAKLRCEVTRCTAGAGPTKCTARACASALRPRCSRASA